MARAGERSSMRISTLERSQNARILVAVNFHYNAARLAIFAEVIRSLSEFPVAKMEVKITTNTMDDGELYLLERLCAETLPGKGYEIRSYQGLTEPWDLAWQHKPIIQNEFINSAGDYSHFFYIE